MQSALDFSMGVLLSGHRATWGGVHSHDVVLNVAPGVAPAQFLSASLTSIFGYLLFCGQGANWASANIGRPRRARNDFIELK